MRALTFVTLLFALLMTLTPISAQTNEIVLDAGKPQPKPDSASGLTRYIISLAPTATAQTYDSIIEKVKQLGGEVVNRFTVIPAITVDLPKHLMGVFAAVPGVESVEEDQPVHAMAGGM